MKSVGHLKPHNGQDGKQGYLGDIVLAGMRGKIALAPNVEKRSDNSPDFTVKMAREGYSGGWEEFGAAWRKSRPESAGGDFISLRIDNEVMGAPINLAAFPPDPDDPTRDQRWVIVWGRARDNVREQVAPKTGASANPF